MERIFVMNDRAREDVRKLRDYPISLRQSARAVYGSVYEHAEKRALETAEQDAPLTKS
ncbi:MAG: hypothetical protein ABW169_08790 [Sphingobium sp.]